MSTAKTIATTGARIKIAVMSDLHCQLERERLDSLLLVGSLRTPAERHPIQSLIKLIDAERFTADVLLVPGDLANKGEREGLSQAWDYVLEVGARLSATAVIPVLGNHDIESRRIVSSRDPTYFARNLRPGFPFGSDADCASFFTDGFCTLNLSDNTQAVLINSVVDHIDPESAQRGTFSVDRIQRLADSLRVSLTAPIRIAMMHHHPALHSGPFSPDLDVIPTGDALLRALSDGGCRLVIHGHKHLARLRHVDNMVIFAAGSFSALMNEYGSAMGNMFHLLDIENPNILATELRGTIKTWTFQLGSGWIKSNLRFRGFPFTTGFGRTAAVPNMVNALSALVSSQSGVSIFAEADVLAAVPELPFMMPDEFEMLVGGLSSLGLKFICYEDGRFDLGKVI